MKILIVEDRFENTLAAAQWASKAGVEIVVKSDLESAKEELNNPEVGGAIIDLEIPRRKGEEPVRCGIEVGEEARKCYVPRVYLSGGYRHGARVEARIFIDAKVFAEIRSEDDLVMVESAPEKSDPQAWERAFYWLKEIAPNMEEIVAARRRYYEFTGKLK